MNEEFTEKQSYWSYWVMEFSWRIQQIHKMYWSSHRHVSWNLVEKQSLK
jgi:hypothetical protein